MGEIESQSAAPYRVLARKYRPRHFGEVVGQDALIRTLKNAIDSGRIAHAYMLTGIRGTGKTTTARLIARALNYAGPDGAAAPTTEPTDDCPICQAIAEDRHPDVLEMDAASRTGVGDIREILDGVRYAPTAARYKVYIIDEVHMLSTAAFNALLKTLEEPPEHVIFIFATTEIRKVPVTVLSRCQRFDLRRIDAGTLADYYKSIAAQENVNVEDDALVLIARAADGSARDGLSLLDQAIARGGDTVTAAQVQDMLGLADRSSVLTLLENALGGQCAPALDTMADLYVKGADPAVILRDMLDFVHLMMRLRAVPQAREGQAQAAMAKETLAQAEALAARLSVPTLGRAWQILLKGLEEIAVAPVPQAAAEMIVIRLAYAADLPDPADLLRRLEKDGAAAPSSVPAAPSPAPARQAEPVGYASYPNGGGTAMAAAQPVGVPASHADPRTLEDVEALLQSGGQPLLAAEVYQAVHLVGLAPGRLDIRPDPDARPGLASDLGRALSALTGTRWVVSISSREGAPTLAERKILAARALADAAREHPVVRGVLEIFPGAALTVIPQQDETQQKKD